MINVFFNVLLLFLWTRFIYWTKEAIQRYNSTWLYKTHKEHTYTISKINYQTFRPTPTISRRYVQRLDISIARINNFVIDIIFSQRWIFPYY